MGREHGGGTLPLKQALEETLAEECSGKDEEPSLQPMEKNPRGRGGNNAHPGKRRKGRKQEIASEVGELNRSLNFRRITAKA